MQKDIKTLNLRYLVEMARKQEKLTVKVLKLLDEDPGQTVKELAEQLKVNRTYPVSYTHLTLPTN